MIILPHSSLEGDRARQEESERIFSRLNSDDFVILLDERGKNLSSPELSNLITEHIDKHIVFIIGGAYGVTGDLRQKSNIVWSLSNLVFPHQLVRLILANNCTALKKSTAVVIIITHNFGRPCLAITAISTCLAPFFFKHLCPSPTHWLSCRKYHQ